MLNEISGNEKELHLASRKLTEFPGQILQCNYLEKLSLYDNDISIIPKEIEKLTHLKELNLSVNNLKSIEHIGTLKNLEILDLSTNPFTELPDTFESLHAITGLMRVTGFKADNGVCLVFELVEFNAGTYAIQSDAVGIATFSLDDWLRNGNGIYFDFYENFPEMDRFTLTPDQSFKIKCRDKTFVINVSRDYIDDCNKYHNSDLKKPPDEAILLFKICETVPGEYLFSTKAHLKQVFKMPESAEMIFSIDNWNHPSTTDVLGDEIPPGENKTIQALVKGVCNGKKPELTEEPTTGWRRNWKSGMME